jgi:hypothetical protein
MPRGLVITIDTEEDQWNPADNGGVSVENIRRIPQLQALFDRLGAIPTYPTTYQVAFNDLSSRVLKEIRIDGRCEIGAHCHPWNTPPFEESRENHSTMVCNLSFDLQYRKLSNIPEMIIDRFESNPTCFRAGRWGFGSSIAEIIEKLGFRVDSSITPHCSWKEYQGPDFSAALPIAYRFTAGDILSPDPEGNLMEIPPTIGFLQKNCRRCASIRKIIMKGSLSSCHLLGLLDRLGILNLRWLSPELSNAREMIVLAKQFMANYQQPLLNLTFHSSSLLPGRNMFVRNKRDLSIFLEKLERFLVFASENDFTFFSLSAAAEVVSKSLVGRGCGRGDPVKGHATDRRR